MKKRIFSILLVTALVVTSLSGCGKNKEAKTADTATETSTVSEDDTKYAIENDNVKVAEYKGLSYNMESTAATDDDVNQFIDYVLEYVYNPNVEAEAAEANNDAAATEDTAATEEEAATTAANDAKETEATKAEETAADTTSANAAETTEAPDTTTTEVGTALTHEDLTDELAAEVSNGEYKTAAEYRAYVKNMIEEENEIYAVQNAKTTLFQEVVSNSVMVGYAEEDLKNYIDYTNNYYAEYAEYLGVDLETFRKENMGFETEDEFNEYIQQEAMSNLKTEYIIKAISEKEGITASEEEINDAIQGYINDGYYATEEDVLNFITKDEITTNIQYTKVLDLIYDSANITHNAATASNVTVETTTPDTSTAPQTDAEPAEESTETK